MIKIVLVPCLVVALVLMPGCAKDPEPKFTAGNIIVGFKKDVTFRQAHDFATQNANGIGHVFGFYYYSNLSNDSLTYLVEYLAEAGFPDAEVRIGFLSNQIEALKDYFNDDDKTTISKWIELTESPDIKFVDMQNSKSMLLFILPGTEKRWLKTHANDALVRYIELDYYLN